MAMKSYAQFQKNSNLSVDDIISRILTVGSTKGTIAQIVTANEIRSLLDCARFIFSFQGAMLEIAAPVKICGDVHGQFSDVLRLFDRGGFPPIVNYLFLGDYVDRGPQSLETVTLFLAYKVKYPKNFFMLRGNHETSAVNRVYGFLDEVCRRYGKEGNELWNAYQTIFSYMPFTALVSEKILCMHGGISEKMTSLDKLRNLQRPAIDIPDDCTEIDLLWADPDTEVQFFAKSTRGISQVFGESALNEVMHQLSVDLICRAHQVVQDGYEFFGNKKLVTIFSAPHYCGSFSNAAGMMNVDKNLICSFQIMRPVVKKRYD